MHRINLLAPLLASVTVGFCAATAQADILSWQQTDPRSWTAEIRISDKGLREARVSALDEVASRLLEELRLPSTRPQHEYVEKLMIVDESFQADGRQYRARLKLASALPDPEFEIEERRSDAFDTETEDVYRPNWVLVVPMDVDTDGSWSLSPAGSAWSSRWKVPFRDGLTQFVPASIDADDRKRAKMSVDLVDLVRHLAARYQSEAVMMVAKSEDGGVRIGQWSSGSGLRASALGSFEPSGSLTDLRARYLEAFWGSVPRGHGADPALREDIEAAISATQRPVTFREVGRPVSVAGGLSGHLQFILQGVGWQSVEQRLRDVPGFDISSVDDRGSSILVRYFTQSADPISLLQAHDFSWE